MERLRLVEELILRYQPSSASYSLAPELAAAVAVILTVTIFIAAVYWLGGQIRTPVVALAFLAILGGCSGESNRQEEEVRPAAQPLTTYSGTVIVERQSGIRESFGLKPAVRKAWLVRATYPGSTKSMGMAISQLNTLMSSQDMAELPSDSAREAFVKRCYVVVGFNDVQIVDPQKY